MNSPAVDPPGAYLTVARSATAEATVSGSRFRCRIARVDDGLSARAVLDLASREDGNALHQGSVTLLGPHGLLTDTGESEGSPERRLIRAELGRAGLSDVTVVVSRWSGETPLAPEGLAEGYAQATRAALELAGTVERVLIQVCEVRVDHTDVGRLEQAMRSRGTQVLGVEYADPAVLRLAVPSAALVVAEELVEELTEGRARLTRLAEEWVDRPHG